MAESEEVPEAVDTLTLRRNKDETEGQAISRYQMRCGVQAGLTIKRAATSELLPLAINPLVSELGRQVAAVQAGDLSDGKRMLTEQAATLDALFHRLVQRGLNSADPGMMERYLRLGFKAQAQARCTVETLAEVVNPRPVAFIKQANVGQAVQVNNGAREVPFLPNEQSGDGHVREDSRASTPAIGSDQAVAALGAIDGTAIGRGQGEVRDECVPGRRASPAAPARKPPSKA